MHHPPFTWAHPIRRVIDRTCRGGPWSSPSRRRRILCEKRLQRRFHKAEKSAGNGNMIVLLLSTTVAISPVDEGKCSTKPQRLPAAIGLLWVRKQHQGFWVFQIRKQRKRLALRIRKRPLVCAFGIQIRYMRRRHLLHRVYALLLQHCCS
uniref:Uncharacterized protein n=1 Tax=Oryza nivara TaxID=4536 RepID=A0A0E0H2E7_ORYNI